jgi:hypothetical protein
MKIIERLYLPLVEAEVEVEYHCFPLEFGMP